jgi:hypothetical protein
MLVVVLRAELAGSIGASDQFAPGHGKNPGCLARLRGYDARRSDAEEPMSEIASQVAVPAGGDRTRALLWITVAPRATVATARHRSPAAIAIRSPLPAADIAATLAIFAFSLAFGNSTTTTRTGASRRRS